MGDWLKDYGKTIYATQRGPIDPNDRFVTTQKGKNWVYPHLIDEKANYLHLDPVPVAIKSIRHFLKLENP